jgi:primary-amine oxidase
MWSIANGNLELLRRSVARVTLPAVAYLALSPVLPAQDAPHPLAPLTEQELQAAVQTLQSAGKLSGNTRLHFLGLREPLKEAVLAWQPPARLPREAFAVLYDYAANQASEAVVNLETRALASWKPVPGVQPALTVEDFQLGDQIVRADPRWQEAVRKRGITDLENVDVGNVSYPYAGPRDPAGHRLQFATPFYKGAGRNGWARPLEGIRAWVDLNDKKVYRFEDSGAVPLAPPDEIDAASLGPARAGLKPLEITQPQGASFELHGQEVRWQKWRFRWGYNPREGVVLYQVGYEDGGRLRPVLYRASLSEMVVPYADPDPSWYVRNYFDGGEYSAGGRVVSLEPLRDAPPNATYFDAHLAGPSGAIRAVPRAMALYERDGGLLWKHYDSDSRSNESRRARELVLASILTIGNYDYAFHWVFRQDASLEMEILLTGIMMVKGVAGHADHDDPYGHAVGPNLRAIHHQHFINFRLDFDVDGPVNSVAEWNSAAAPPGAANPAGTTFTMRETKLLSELHARRNMDLAANRKWRIFNPEVKNALGFSTGYLLMLGENSVTYAQPDSLLRRRAAFLGYHLWVTRQTPGQNFAAGDYPAQSRRDSGLAQFSRANRSVVSHDLVLWYTVGVTHLPRPEEWPVMPVHKAGFKLVPAGFFARNPALDVPK